MVFGRRAFFGYAVRPSGETYWFSNHVRIEAPSRQAFHSFDEETLREQLSRLHRDDPPAVTRILQAIENQLERLPSTISRRSPPGTAARSA